MSEPSTHHELTQFNDYDTSTLRCACGAELTWSGLDDRVNPFRAEHSGGKIIRQIITTDGERAYGGKRQDV